MTQARTVALDGERMDRHREARFHAIPSPGRERTGIGPKQSPCPTTRTSSHRRGFVAVVAVSLLGALAGCGSKAPATGVARIGRVVEVAYKPCDDAATAGIERLDLFSSDDPDHPVWTARRRSGGTAVLELPVVGRFPGYAITDRRPGSGFDEGQRYSFEATALDGTEWGGPGFRYADLRNGRVRVAGQDLDFATWIDEPASCPDIGLGGALLTGLVVAAVAGGALIVARGVRLLTRRVRGVET